MLGDDELVCFSLMFYDITNKLGPEWVDLIERLFRIYGCDPINIILHGARKRKGSFKRIRSHLIEDLEAARSGEAVHFRIGSAPTEDGVSFFASDISVSINTSGPGCAQGVFSVRERCDRNFEDFVDYLVPKLVPLTGMFYGYASKFPAILGPGAYAASLGTIPKGWSFTSTRSYTKRITTWRDNIRDRRGLNGFFREVYPVNFLTRAHLDQEISGKLASEIFEEFGSLKQLAGIGDMFVWWVPLNRIAVVREILENENLILSAYTRTSLLSPKTI